MNIVVEVIKIKEVFIWELFIYLFVSYFNNLVYEIEKIDVDLELMFKKKIFMCYLLWYLNFMKLCLCGYFFINDFKIDD